MLEGAFEPMIMFFGLTNSLATFQAIINDLLRNIIEARDIVVFIDDVMVGTETEKGHDEIVKEVLKKMEENNLFVKLEKYVQKIRKVGFLGVVIELDKVKMKKEKG